MTTQIELEQENKDLREALEIQWEFNHAEHCTNMPTHPIEHICHWPKPVILGVTPSDWRPY